MQAPFEHRWPGPHGAFAPHLHPPPVQLSLVLGLHALQTPPPVPQVEKVAGLQVLPAQQPFRHELGVQPHTPLLHAWPVAQGTPLTPQEHAPLRQRSALAPHTEQAWPPTPQLEVEAVLQVLPTQHPPGHEVASQMQLPFEQRWPAPHAAFEPQRQVPAAVQVSVSLGSQGLQLPPAVPQFAVEPV
jgi:hypothetical protein